MGSEAPKLNAEFLEEFTYGDVGHSDGGYTLIAHIEGDKHRWYTQYMMVLDGPDGALWGCHFDEGATEMQEIEPFENYVDENDDVELFRVRAEAVTITRYVRA